MFSVLELEVTKIHILTYLFSKLQITGESTYYFKIIFAAFTSFIWRALLASTKDGVGQHHFIFPADLDGCLISLK